MHRCLYLLLGLVVAFALALPATAAADITLGTTAQPAGSSPGNCAAGYMIGQETSDPSTPDTVPPPGGQITGWQTNTTGDTAGSGLTLVVLRPNEGAYTVVGVDPEVLPTPLPTDGIATFTLPTPLQVQSGDVLSLYSFNGVGNCAWGGVSDAADRISLFMLAVAPGPADSLLSLIHI